MRHPDWLQRVFSAWPMAVAVVLLLVAGLIWETVGGRQSGLAGSIFGRQSEGIYRGALPAPVEPSLMDPVIEPFAPERDYRLMSIRHIRRIKEGSGSPHPFVGDCKNCHLYLGGPGPGNQPITPVGQLMQELSKMKKLGPPLRPTSNRPHPPAGRCIKCHDIVVKVPVGKKMGGFLWKL
jgi:hypothetical protein